jgi:hypothetical protein
MTTPTAKTFRNPLLTVLGNESGWKAEEGVNFNTVIDAVCAAEGLTRDEHGARDYDEKPWVVIWIRDAFRWAKRRGLGKQIRRGLWALTEDGLAHAADVAGHVLTVAPLDDDSKADESTGLSLVVGPGNPDEGYHSNPYVRSTAAAQTECFGNYSPKSPTCGSCGLSGGCQNLVAALYSVLASELAAKDAEAAKAAKDAMVRPPAGDPTPAPTPAPKDTAPTPPKGGWDNSGSQPIVSFVDSTCYRCGKAIPKGEDCFWVKDGDQKGGMYHLACK